MLWLAGGVRSIDDRVSSSPNGGWLDEGNVVRRGGTNTAFPAPHVCAWLCRACVFSGNAIHRYIGFILYKHLKTDVCIRL